MTLRKNGQSAYSSAKAAYDAQIAALRLRFRTETAHLRPSPKQLTQDEHYDMVYAREFVPPSPDGSAVVNNGIVLSRREFKRLVHSRCGYMPTLDECLSRHDSLPTATRGDKGKPVARGEVPLELQPAVTAKDDMRALFCF